MGDKYCDLCTVCFAFEIGKCDALDEDCEHFKDAVPKCEDCYIGYENGYENCDKGLRYESDMSGRGGMLTIHDIETQFNFCPICGHRIKKWT